MIRSFTPSATQVFNLLPGDRGRPLTDITGGLDYPALREDVEAVLRKGQPQERQVARRDGTAHYLARIAPYRLADGSTAGVIATFAAVTSVVRAEAHQRMLVAELNHRVKNTLAVVLGIAAASLESSPGRDAFVARVKALARAHDLLARDGWAAVSLTELLRAETAPYLARGGALRAVRAGAVGAAAGGAVPVHGAARDGDQRHQIRRAVGRGRACRAVLVEAGGARGAAPRAGLA